MTAQEQQLPFFLGNWRRALIRRRLYAAAWRLLVVALCVALVGVALYRLAAGAVPLWPIVVLPLAVWIGGVALVARRHVDFKRVCTCCCLP